MKHIYLNLKRFDICPRYGGVNRLAPAAEWGRTIVERTQEALRGYRADEAEFVMYFPEAHILPAAAAKTPGFTGPTRRRAVILGPLPQTAPATPWHSWGAKAC